MNMIATMLMGLTGSGTVSAPNTESQSVGGGFAAALNTALSTADNTGGEFAIGSQSGQSDSIALNSPSPPQHLMKALGLTLVSSPSGLGEDAGGINAGQAAGSSLVEGVLIAALEQVQSTANLTTDGTSTNPVGGGSGATSSDALLAALEQFEKLLAGNQATGGLAETLKEQITSWIASLDSDGPFLSAVTQQAQNLQAALAGESIVDFRFIGNRTDALNATLIPVLEGLAAELTGHSGGNGQSGLIADPSTGQLVTQLLHKGLPHAQPTGTDSNGGAVATSKSGEIGNALTDAASTLADAKTTSQTSGQSDLNKAAAKVSSDTFHADRATMSDGEVRTDATNKNSDSTDTPGARGKQQSSASTARNGPHLLVRAEPLTPEDRSLLKQALGPRQTPLRTVLPMSEPDGVPSPDAFKANPLSGAQNTDKPADAGKARARRPGHVGLLQKALSESDLALPNARSSDTRPGTLNMIAGSQQHNSTLSTRPASLIAGDLTTLSAQPGIGGSELAGQSILGAGQGDGGTATITLRATSASGQSHAPQLPTTALAVQIAAHAQNGVRRFDIRLDPPELGRVDVKLEFAADGKVATHLIVDRPETLELFQRDARQLERALANTGLNTDQDGLSFSLKNQGQGLGRNGLEESGSHAEGFTNNEGEDTEDIDAGPQPIPLTRLTATNGVDIRI